MNVIKKGEKPSMKEPVYRIRCNCCNTLFEFLGCEMKSHIRDINSSTVGTVCCPVCSGEQSVFGFNLIGSIPRHNNDNTDPTDEPAVNAERNAMIIAFKIALNCYSKNYFEFQNSIIEVLTALDIPYTSVIYGDSNEEH